jgi:hypothetical protein
MKANACLRWTLSGALAIARGGPLLFGPTLAVEPRGVYERALVASASFGDAAAAFEGALPGSTLALQCRPDRVRNEPTRRVRAHLLRAPRNLATAVIEAAGPSRSGVGR